MGASRVQDSCARRGVASYDYSMIPGTGTAVPSQVPVQYSMVPVPGTGTVRGDTVDPAGTWYNVQYSIPGTGIIV